MSRLKMKYQEKERRLKVLREQVAIASPISEVRKLFLELLDLLIVMNEGEHRLKLAKAPFL